MFLPAASLSAVSVAGYDVIRLEVTSDGSLDAGFASLDGCCGSSVGSTAMDVAGVGGGGGGGGSSGSAGGGGDDDDDPLSVNKFIDRTPSSSSCRCC